MRINNSKERNSEIDNNCFRLSDCCVDGIEWLVVVVGEEGVLYSWVYADRIKVDVSGSTPEFVEHEEYHTDKDESSQCQKERTVNEDDREENTRIFIAATDRY